MARFVVLVVIVRAFSCAAQAQPASPTGLWPSVEALLLKAIADKHCPGAVVVLGHEDGISLISALGHHALVPEPLPLGTDAIFDSASLTKVVVTATAILLLVDEGRLRLEDRAVQYWPEFGVQGKDAIDIEDLLRHRSGLLADNALSDYENDAAEAWRRIAELPLKAEVGKNFIYSDVGYLVLGQIVERITGQSLDRFARERIFEPLGMRDTGFLPVGKPLTADRVQRIVPTEPARPGESPLCGVVHDPRARALSGVAGHAGLFTTGADLGRFARMILRGGVSERGQVFLSPRTIQWMTHDGGTPTNERRGLGFDIATSYSTPRGQGFSARSFGHTGFTGTSLWIDPASSSFLILLTSARHPDGKGNVKELRKDLATAVAKELVRPVFSGLDRLDLGRAQWPERFANSRVGLITNHTGRTRNGVRGVEVLRRVPGITLTAIFSPEHGFDGKLDKKVGDTRDKASGLPVFSLYGETRRPTPQMLESVDVLVFDIQDIGTRFYTYISTMLEAMSAASELNKGFVVLDRPNVIGSTMVEGPIADKASLDFVGALPIPIRHGLTVGEVAHFARSERKLDLNLEIIRYEGVGRSQHYDETGLPWIHPSPNMRSPTEALLYPGIGILETTNVSVGRGTDTPFEVFGAPWIESEILVREFSRLRLPGIRAQVTSFTPTASTHQGVPCHGLRFEVFDSGALEPVKVGVALAILLRRHFAKDFDRTKLDRLLKHRATLEAIERGDPLETILRKLDSGLAEYLARRAEILLY